VLMQFNSMPSNTLFGNFDHTCCLDLKEHTY
jgi:hypothetical protein